MAARATMAALIARVRLLTNDPEGSSSIFADQDIQDVLDESRIDIKNGSMEPKPTFSGATIQYLDYYTALGGWEDDLIIKQYLINVVTPSLSEPIAGHFAFATTMLPPLYISGKTYDVYRAAADLLERWAARVVLNYDFSSDGQSFKRSQAADALQKLAVTYRRKQRAGSITVGRSDLTGASPLSNVGLGPTELDYIASGQ